MTALTRIFYMAAQKFLIMTLTQVHLKYILLSLFTEVLVLKLAYKRSLPKSEFEVCGFPAITSPFYGIWYSSLIILKDQGFAWTVRKNLQNSLQVHGISSFSRKFEQIACKSLKRINLILSKLNCFSTLRMSILEQFEGRVQGYIL